MNLLPHPVFVLVTASAILLIELDVTRFLASAETLDVQEQSAMPAGTDSLNIGVARETPNTCQALFSGM